MLTAHILTKNNAQTVQKTLESLQPRVEEILVVDLGSTDETISICETMANVYPYRGFRHDARNFLASKSKNELNLWIEPWEALIQLGNSSKTAYVTIINDKIVSKDIRLWQNGIKFINPVYESLDVKTNEESNTIIYSGTRQDYDDLLKDIQLWKNQSSLSTAPYYYEACIHLAKGDWDKFLTAAEYYLFLDNGKSKSSIMTRYYYALAYYALAHTMHTRNIKLALQHLFMCLASRPLMAEFWCLWGDINYHLLKRFDEAKCLYENAIIMGSRRLKNDKWPMDTSKYRAYPKTMIESCDKILQSTCYYGISSK
jgi:glycosyltransferase involved in cell wall biosynthesis